MAEYYEGEFNPEENKEFIVGIIIDTLAIGLFSGEIEDTLMPRERGRLHLDTLIKEEIGCESPKELKMIKDRVYTRLYDLAGGCNMSR